jgi:hypothetical protein
MRRLIYAAVGAATLATASIANSTVIVNSSTGVDLPTILTSNGATQSTIVWGQDLTNSGSFNGSIDFSNNLSGLYSIIVSSSTPGAVVDALSLAGILGTSGTYSSTGSTNSISLLVPFAGSGDYRVSFGGTAPPNGAAVTGNLTFQIVAVPEPATWTMLVLGFGAVGFVMRRRRRPTMAQLA